MVRMDWKNATANLRRHFRQASRAVERDVPDLAERCDLTINGATGALPARLYVPLNASTDCLTVFFHGGGFVIGDLDGYDTACCRLATAARCPVLSVAYRLAPEHRFPCAHDDAIAAWRWISTHSLHHVLTPGRIAVAGDSAGGNLAAFVAQETRRRNWPGPVFQLLLYPLLQFTDIRTRKLTFRQGGFFISSGLYQYFRETYLGKERDGMDVRVAPLFASHEDTRNLASAHLVLCGWDPLKDEGHAYAAKLAAHGVPVSVREHENLVHGFINLTAFSMPARKAIQDAGQVLGRALGTFD